MNKEHLKLYRALFFGSGIAYLIWWCAVEILLPGSYNPFFGRSLIVGLFFLILIGSYFSPHLAKHIGLWFLIASSAGTLHYFYLFYFNKLDVNWVIGSYITVIVVCACIQSLKALLAYCVFTLVLSLSIVIAAQDLLKTIFLPGMMTVLSFAYFGLEFRLQLAGELQSKDEFISIISHELKTPLTSIKLLTQTAQRSMQKGDEFKRERMLRVVEQTDRQANRLASLIEDMLDISRIAMGKLEIQKARFNFTQMMTEVIDSLSDLMKESGCVIKTNLEPNVSLSGDRFRLEQLILNLLTNAVKYGAGQPIEVELKSNTSGLNFTVKDHGSGIARENHERIFQRFERAVSTKGISGLGLGLYICKHIVQSHQGQISVESALGQGATFKVRLVG